MWNREAHSVVLAGGMYASLAVQATSDCGYLLARRGLHVVDEVASWPSRTQATPASPCCAGM